jgi:hypothetical protein
MATTVPDREKSYNINYYNILYGKYGGMNEKTGGEGRRNCPIFRTRSEKPEMAA